MMEQSERDLPLTELIRMIREGLLTDEQTRELMNLICGLLQPRLVESCHGRLHSQLLTKEGESDLVQEALLGVAQNFHSFRGQTAGELYAWALAILDNKSLELQRRYLGVLKRDIALERSIPTSESSDVSFDLEAHTSTPLDKLVTAEEATRVRTIIDQLPEVYREVVQLRHSIGLTFPEIAARVGRTEPSVKNVYVRAMEILKRETERQ